MTAAANFLVQGVLSNAQILSMGTGANALVLVPAQGPGTLIKPKSVQLILRTSDNVGSPSLSTGLNIQMGWGTAINTSAIAGTGGTQTCTTSPPAVTGGFDDSFFKQSLAGNAASQCDFTVTSVSQTGNTTAIGPAVTAAAGFAGNNQPIVLRAGTALTNTSGAGITLQYRIEYVVVSSA